MGWFVTKKQLKETIAKKDLELSRCAAEIKCASMDVDCLRNALKEVRSKFPFDLGDVVYDVELRSSKGRFTKKNASLDHSIITEVKVTTKNYFNLVKRYESSDVYLYRADAEAYIKSVCVE